jgi:hypothetical protein
MRRFIPSLWRISKACLQRHFRNSAIPAFGLLPSIVTDTNQRRGDRVDKQWLWDTRNISGQVGKLAIEAMDTRTRRWRSRRERDPMIKHSKVGNAVELVAYKKTERSVIFTTEPWIFTDVVFSRRL